MPTPPLFAPPSTPADLARAHRELHTTSQLLRTLVHASPLAIVAFDAEQHVLSWNHAAEQLFGWREHEVLGHPAPNVPPEAQEDFRRQFADVMRGAAFTGCRALRRRKDGAPLDVSLSAAPLRDDGNAVVGIMMIIADITERIQLEEQLRQAQKMEAVGRLAGGIAHDFNNLLTVIRCHADLLHGSLDAADPRRADTAEVVQSADRASSLTRQLLAFSRKQVLQPRIVDLNVVVADMERMLSRLIDATVELVTIPAPGLGHVRADPGQLEQVLVNLALNARDAMPRGGSIIIETANVVFTAPWAHTHGVVRAGEYVMLSVTDNGRGMTAEVQAHCFEPFFTTKEQGKGTGLGLSTVYGIVRQSGGHVTFRTELGKGTTFTVYLPRLATGTPIGLPAIGGDGLPRGTETVLVVEDESAVRALVKRLLEKQGYRVLEARHGADAIALCQRQDAAVDLLLTDMVMPEMGGTELVERLQATSPELRALYMSGYTAGSSEHHEIIAPRSAFISKPFSAEELVRRVRAALDS
ncbi:MAG TPA: ATP-binding protein [Gemmatimonadaceae bacterium]